MESHTRYGNKPHAMKMTMHIDETLLAIVMQRYHLETKTDAVEFALRELVRLDRLREYRTGLGVTPEELRRAYSPTYDPDIPGSEFLPGEFSTRVAEDSPPY